MKLLLVVSLFAVAALAKVRSNDDYLRVLLEDGNKKGIVRGDSAGRIHHVERRTTRESLAVTLAGGSSNSSQGGETLKKVLSVPAGTLNMVREVTVPLVNSSLALPVNVLHGIARYPMTNLTLNKTGHHHHRVHGHNMSHHHHHLHHLGALNMSSIRLPFNLSGIYLPINMSHPSLNFTSIALTAFNYSAMSHHLAPVTSMLRGLHNVSFSEQLHPSNLTKHFDSLKKYLGASSSPVPVNQTVIVSGAPTNLTVKV